MGGNSKTILVATVSGAVVNSGETLSTLKVCGGGGGGGGGGGVVGVDGVFFCGGGGGGVAVVGVFLVCLCVCFFFIVLRRLGEKKA